MSFVFLELSNILLAVGPDQVALPMHLIVEPVAIVFFVVGPLIDPVALDLVHVELALVD